MGRSALAVLVFALTLASARSEAAPIFMDNFDTENGGVPVLNFNGFDNFNVNFGTVDLIGNGYFDFLPGNGLYVDLDGSTSNSGIMTADPLALSAGNYALSFDLAGSHRETTETVVVNVWGWKSLSYALMVKTLASADPFNTYLLPFTLASSDSVRFSFAGVGNDNIGLLLDRVSLDTVAAAHAPEPSTIAMMTIGLGLMVRQYRRRLAAPRN